MDLEARISKEWRKRMLLMFSMLFGIAAWFLSDGYYFWPKENLRHGEYQAIIDKLVSDGKAEDAESSSVQVAWQRHARESGYKSKIPKERTNAAIREQLVIGWGMLIGTLIFGSWIIWNHRYSIRREGDVVVGVSGQRVSLDSIVAIDRKKWKNKGIAYAIYQVEGKEKRLCLDAHKYSGCESIILEAERRIGARES